VSSLGGIPRCNGGGGGGIPSGIRMLELTSLTWLFSVGVVRGDCAGRHAVGDVLLSALCASVTTGLAADG